MGDRATKVKDQQDEIRDLEAMQESEEIPQEPQTDKVYPITGDNRQQQKVLLEALKSKGYMEREVDESTRTRKIKVETMAAKKRKKLDNGRKEGNIDFYADSESQERTFGQKAANTSANVAMQIITPIAIAGVNKGISSISEKTHPERQINQTEIIQDHTTHEKKGESFLSFNKTVRIYPTITEQDGKVGKGDVTILTRNLVNIDDAKNKNKIEIEEIKDCEFSMSTEEDLFISVPDEIKVKIDGKEAIMKGVKFVEGKLQVENIVDNSITGFCLTGITFQSGNIYYKDRYTDINIPENISLGNIFSYNRETGEIHINDINYKHEFLKKAIYESPAFAAPPPLDFVNFKLKFSPILKAGFRLSAECSNIKGLIEEESSAIDIGFQGVLEGDVGVGASADLNLQLPGTAFIAGAPGFYAGLWGKLYAALKGGVTMKTAIQKEKGKIILAKDMEFDVDSNIQLRGSAGFHTGANLLFWKGDFIKIIFGEWVMSQINAGGKFARLKNGEWELRDSFFDISGFGKRLYENNSAENFYGLSVVEEKIQNKMDTSYENVIALAKDPNTIHALKGDTTSTEFIDKIEELREEFLKLNKEAKENLLLLTAMKDVMQGDEKIQKQMKKLQSLQSKHQERIEQLKEWENAEEVDIYEKYEEKYGGAGYKKFRESSLEEKAKQEIMTLEELIQYEMKKVNEISSDKKILKHENRVFRLGEKERELQQMDREEGEEEENEIEETEKQDKKKQMLEFYKGELDGGKGFVRDIQKHATPDMLLKYERKRKAELIKGMEEIQNKLQEFINEQMEQDQTFDINKPNQKVYEYYKEIGGKAGEAFFARNSEMDKVATGEDIIQYEQHKVEMAKEYQKHLERILWLENMVKIRDVGGVTDEEVVEKYKIEKKAKRFETEILSMALSEDIIQYETNRRTALREKNDNRVNALEEAKKDGKSLEEIKKLYSDMGGTISHAEKYAKEHRGNKVTVEDILTYENERLNYYKSKKDSKEIEKHVKRIELLKDWRASSTEEEVIQKYQKEFNAERFIKQSYEKQQDMSITVEEIIAYERSKADKKSETHTKRLQYLNQLKEQDASEVEIKRAYEELGGGTGFEKSVQTDIKSGKRKIKIENLIAYERSRLNKLTDGHLARVERLQSVKKVGATEEQLKAEYTMLGGGTGFKRDLQDKKDTFLTPKKLLEYESIKIKEKSEKHEKRIKMLEQLQGANPEEVREKYNMERIREKTKGKSIGSGLSEKVNGGMLFAGITKKGRFEKDVEENIQEYIEPEQIIQYEEKRSKELQQKHQDRLEMLKQMAVKKVTDKEAREEYQKKGGKGFEKAYKGKINERKKQKMDSNEMKGVNDIKEYETSRLTYYNNRIQQLNNPILKTEEGIQKVEKYTKDCEKILKEINLVKKEPDGKISSFITLLEEYAKIPETQEEQSQIEENYGEEAVQMATDVLQQMEEEEHKSVE